MSGNCERVCKLLKLRRYCAFRPAAAHAEPYPVTAEAAGSSPVVPAILSKGVIGRDTENSYPQSHPQLLLNASRFESHGVEEFFLSSDHLVEVFVRVKVERGLDTRMIQDTLHSL